MYGIASVKFYFVMFQTKHLTFSLQSFRILSNQNKSRRLEYKSRNKISKIPLFFLLRLLFLSKWTKPSLRFVSLEYFFKLIIYLYYCIFIGINLHWRHTALWLREDGCQVFFWVFLFLFPCFFGGLFVFDLRIIVCMFVFCINDQNRKNYNISITSDYFAAK